MVHAYQIPVYGFPEGAYITSADVAAQLATAAQTRLDALRDAQGLRHSALGGAA